ncbi:RNA polymerase sigma-70 factor (ECF subfamily) [Chitinophaga niastensis]|uniref:RNA polymerase sigma-70 factor (ECF subfamily) n=1 Tax=Chitinophaga niastensis TaxID=536980 RepID=A0A2P8HP71_CHINA|nr:RNA polymerase sigma-70 factor [Chitinophaga niastensis]PSL48016.1 RNA polymerase sigma-70 factor (ECF subfamily) [Chitinophaga niastensis]
MFHVSHIQELQRRITLYDDEAAYKELFIHFYNPLLQFANSFVRSNQVAEEVVSDVFINIWEMRRRLPEIAHLKVYLYVSTKNLSLKYLLKQQKKAAISIDEVVVDIESPDYNPEELIVNAELIASYEKAVSSLPPRCKLIFKLIKEDGLKYKEIAEILNISVKTIDSQLSIALAKIARAINTTLKKPVRL